MSGRKSSYGNQTGLPGIFEIRKGGKNLSSRGTAVSVCSVLEYGWKAGSFNYGACASQVLLQLLLWGRGKDPASHPRLSGIGLCGKGGIQTENIGKDIVFRKGELCLIDKNCVHQDYLQNKESVILFLGLSNNMFTEVMNENVSTEKVISFLQSALLKQKNLQQYIRFKPSPETEAALEKAFEQLVEELLVNDTGSTFICKGLMVRIFGLLSTGCEFSLSRELRQEMSWIVYEEITEYIAHHYATVTIRELVENFHFQEDYFNRLIRSKAGISYSEYVQRIRLEKAEALLRTSSMTVDEVAEAVGYQNKGYFYKIFKKEFGMTPRQMRVNGL